MNERDKPAVLWPTYALRAWLSALVSETHRSQLEVDARIELFEKEIARLHKQKERSKKVMESLRESIGIVDDVLRRVRDAGADDRDKTDELKEEGADAKRHSQGRRPANSPPKK